MYNGYLKDPDDVSKTRQIIIQPHSALERMPQAAIKLSE